MARLRGVYITHVLDCLADPTKIRVTAELSDDVQSVLPYVATLLPEAGYNHAAGILTLLYGGRLLTVYSRLVFCHGCFGGCHPFATLRAGSFAAAQSLP